MSLTVTTTVVPVDPLDGLITYWNQKQIVLSMADHKVSGYYIPRDDFMKESNGNVMKTAATTGDFELAFPEHKDDHRCSKSRTFEINVRKYSNLVFFKESPNEIQFLTIWA